MVHDYMGNDVEEDHKLQSIERYRRPCITIIRLETEGSIRTSTFSLVHYSAFDITKKVMEKIGAKTMASSTIPPMTQ